MRDTDWEILSILYETRNITKTAEMMYMTQPTLTRRLQQIEEDLGAVLLTRSNKGVQFTAEGSFAALKAREIMQAISGVREGIALKEGGELKGTLRLGAPKSYLHSIVPKILRTAFMRSLWNLRTERALRDRPGWFTTRVLSVSAVLQKLL